MIFFNITSSNQLAIKVTEEFGRHELDRIFLFLDAHLDDGVYLEFFFNLKASIKESYNQELKSYILQNQHSIISSKIKKASKGLAYINTTKLAS